MTHLVVVVIHIASEYIPRRDSVVNGTRFRPLAVTKRNLMPVLFGNVFLRGERP